MQFGGVGMPGKVCRNGHAPLWDRRYSPGSEQLPTPLDPTSHKHHLGTFQLVLFAGIPAKTQDMTRSSKQNENFFKMETFQDESSDKDS